MIKSSIQKIVGLNRLMFILNLKGLFSNFWTDFKLYYKYSNVFKIDNLDKEEAQLILHYHSVEKGMLFTNMKLGFAQSRIEILHEKLRLKSIIDNVQHRSQILVAYQVMCKYYELHQEKGFDISSFYTKDQYESYKLIINKNYSNDFQGVLEYKSFDFYKDVESSFEKFAYTRKSVRDFTGERIEKEIIGKAVQLSLTAPSVCNRQASKVYLLEDKVKIDKVLKIQGGFEGYTKNVNQLLVLTNDRNYYYTIGERNQFYIDGGVFLMNLLYSLHYYKIANCPANWGKLVKEEESLSEVIKIPTSEKIICMIPIGKAKDNFRVTLSQRRNLNEVLKVI